MKKLIATAMITALAVFALQAADSEPVTLEGTLSCAKCNLGLADKCADVLEVTEGDATVQYWLLEDGKGKTSAHKCSGTTEAKVTGTVEEKDGKKILTVTSIES